RRVGAPGGGARGRGRNLHAAAAGARPPAPLPRPARVTPPFAAIAKSDRAGILARDAGAIERAARMMARMSGSDKTTTSPTPADKAAHYHGHRQRLRQRFLAAGSEAISDYEMLELILFRA